MSDTEKSGPFKSLGSKVALAVVAVIVVAGLFVAVTSIIRGSSPTPDPTSTSSSDDGEGSEDPVSSEDESICGLAGFEDESSLEDAPEAEWELVGTIVAPSDTQVSGPGRIDSDGFRSCYSHTAEGALFAAVNYVAMSSDRELQPRLKDAIAPGPGRDAIAPSTDDASGARLIVAGFSIPSYSSDAATVDVVYNLSTGQLVSFPLKLEWIEGDWKIVVTDEGKLPLDAAQVANLGGYTPWAAGA